MKKKIKLKIVYRNLYVADGWIPSKRKAADFGLGGHERVIVL